MGISKIINQLRRNKDIRIITSEKNLGFCVVSTRWYNNEAFRHLNDPITYQLIFDQSIFTGSISTQHDNLNDFRIKFLNNIYLKLKHIFQDVTTIESKFILQKFNEFNPKFFQFYLLPKVHKLTASNQDLLARPICSSNSYVTYHASKYVDIMLQPLMKKGPQFLSNSRNLLQIIEERPFHTYGG